MRWGTSNLDEPEPENSTQRRREAKPQRFFDSLFARFLYFIPSLLLNLPFLNSDLRECVAPGKQPGFHVVSVDH